MSYFQIIILLVSLNILILFFKSILYSLQNYIFSIQINKKIIFLIF